MIKIGNRIISIHSKPLIVSEIGINHFGSLSKAKKIVDKIKNAGGEAVKVQIHIPDEEMSEEAKSIKPGNSNLSIYDVIKNNSLNLDDELKLKKYIERNNLIYIATPFSFKAAEWLNKNKVKIFKIGSGECNNHPLIKFVASFKKPMIISTGMNTISSVTETYKIVKKSKTPHAFLHCVNLYPTNYNLVRLSRINTFKKIFKNSLIGYSDHTEGTDIAKASLVMGAKIIEKHFAINKNKKGPDISCSMDTNELKDLITFSNKINLAFKNNNDLIKEENITRKFAFHSVVSKMNIQKGEKLNYSNLTIKRPGTGFYPANRIGYLIGKKARRFIKQNRLIKKKDV
tara:strand:- start:1058 stop:2086 length:1029 start_codon:yes stop_codon:yes gene_type:complete